MGGKLEGTRGEGQGLPASPVVKNSCNARGTGLDLSLHGK